MNKTVLISGVSGSIGSFLANYFLANNCFVIGISRKTFNPIENRDNYRHFAVDITQELGIVALFKTLRTEKIPINAFIHCAGVSSASPTTIISSETLQNINNLNINASEILLREVLKAMVTQRGGAVVNMSSITVSAYNQGSAVYASSKIAFEHFCKIAAIENARYGIRINTLRLPVVENTNMQQEISAETEAKLINKTILQRKIELSEIANLCKWLIGDDSKIVTGETITPGGIW